MVVKGGLLWLPRRVAGLRAGDGCRRDADGYYFITGRVDDVINVSGHRLGSAEVESALVSHPLCAEAAVVPVEHAIKGQALYAFVTLMEVRCGAVQMATIEQGAHLTLP